MQTPQRVLYVTALGHSTELYGSEKSLLTLADDVTRADGWEAAIAGTAGGACCAAARDQGIAYHSALVAQASPRGLAHELPDLWRSARGLAHLIARTGTHIVHANELEACQASVLAGRLARVPVVCYVRRLYSRREFVWNLGGCTAAVVSPSRAALAAVGVEEGAIGMVAYDPLDLPPIPTAGEMRSARRELGLPEGSVVFCLVGRVTAAKGQMVFLRALARTAHACPAVYGLLVGGTTGSRESKDYFRQVEGLVRGCDLSQRTMILGYRSDITKVWVASDVSVLPSQSECLPRVLTEAMSYGRPTIGSNIGGIPEVGEPGRTGLLFELDDVSGLAAHMRLLAGNEDLRRRMGMAARRWVEENLTREKHLERILAVYDQVLRQRR